jgi:hypothetical protein
MSHRPTQAPQPHGHLFERIRLAHPYRGRSPIHAAQIPAHSYRDDPRSAHYLKSRAPTQAGRTRSWLRGGGIPAVPRDSVLPKRCGAQLREMFVLCPERISDLSAAVPVAATVDGMTLNRGIRRGRCLDMLLYHDVDASKLGPRVMIDIYSIK